VFVDLGARNFKDLLKRKIEEVVKVAKNFMSSKLIYIIYLWIFELEI
jgi:hypothetical protein